MSNRIDRNVQKWLAQMGFVAKVVLSRQCGCGGNRTPIAGLADPSFIRLSYTAHRPAFGGRDDLFERAITSAVLCTRPRFGVTGRYLAGGIIENRRAWKTV